MAREVLPVVRDVPVIAGVNGTDPFVIMDQYLDDSRSLAWASRIMSISCPNPMPVSSRLARNVPSMRAREVLPVVRDVPVIAGVNGTDPFVIMDQYLDELASEPRPAMR
jgi:predicted TIM-barrel enzyme